MTGRVVAFDAVLGTCELELEDGRRVIATIPRNPDGSLDESRLNAAATATITKVDRRARRLAAESRNPLRVVG